MTLALTASAAAALARPAPVVAVFISGALIYNLPATYLWHEAGGGNSGATFFLVTAMLGFLVVREPYLVRCRVAAAVVAGAARCCSSSATPTAKPFSPVSS